MTFSFDGKMLSTFGISELFLMNRPSFNVLKVLHILEQNLTIWEYGRRLYALAEAHIAYYSGLDYRAGGSLILSKRLLLLDSTEASPQAGHLKKFPHRLAQRSITEYSRCRHRDHLR